MPLVNVISFRINDAKGESQRTKLYTPVGATIPELQALIDLYAVELDAITMGQITAVTAQVTMVLPGGLKTGPVANSDIQEGANMRFDVAASNYTHSIRVPALVQSLFSGREVNIADVAVTDWATVVSDGTAAVDPTDSKGGDLLTLLSGKKTFHK